MDIWFYSIVSVSIVSLISLIGVFTLVLKKDVLKKILLFFVSFSIGSLFGDAFIHLIPEAFEKLGINIRTSMYIILGIFIFFALEKFVRWRHCHAEECEGHVKPYVVINLVGDSFHNLIDGMMIGASFSVSFTIGITTTIAIILHEIPQEIGDFSILVQGGLSAKKALFFNFLSAIVSIFGAIISLIIGNAVEDYKFILLPVTAGGFIYIAGSDLIPELHHELDILKSIIQMVCILLGIGIMALLIFVG